MKVLRYGFILVCIVLLCSVLYLCFWPVSIDPGPGSVQPAPALTGDYATNTALDGIQRLLAGLGVGPEDVTTDSQGRLYTGYQDGRIVRFRLDGGGQETFVNTGGRPLGMAWDAAGNLIVADADRGLLSIDSKGEISILSSTEGGVPFGFADDVDVASDGMIYFTDASWKFHVKDYLADLMEHRGNGRFLSYDPKTKRTTKLIDGMYFANGVALAPDQSFVLVNETWKYRVMRYWLTGPKKGTTDVFIDNLPGFPDNISTSPDGHFWLALPNPRNALADGALAYPFIRKMIWRLPASLRPQPDRYAFVLGLDTNAKIVRNLQSLTAPYAPITSVNEFNGALYFGSIGEDAVGTINAPKA